MTCRVISLQSSSASQKKNFGIEIAEVFGSNNQVMAVIFHDRGKVVEFAELPTLNGIREMTQNHGISFVIS